MTSGESLGAEFHHSEISLPGDRVTYLAYHYIFGAGMSVAYIPEVVHLTQGRGVLSHELL